ncbi:hypothetical protein [Pelomicrobium methylotrophicum]|uniref:Uncharacterized protein n=1 Tax=Pelomicrobium methylotrophicum TaxID=2602750 RepID=A0A5C7EJ99_9PROT|nr:hypothetical protein [Pelomicrobium methylotrophicum]TXF12542.1 hypothetical protein FR698_04705 [Pelomicrobium methylotrophicum]
MATSVSRAAKNAISDALRAARTLAKARLEGLEGACRFWGPRDPPPLGDPSAPWLCLPLKPPPGFHHADIVFPGAPLGNRFFIVNLG